MRITRAYSGADLCGYCISTAQNGSGELVSLQVIEDMRGHGFGKLLTNDHLHWLKEMGRHDIAVQSAIENAPTIGFYQHMGFRMNYVTMPLKEHPTCDQRDAINFMPNP